MYELSGQQLCWRGEGKLIFVSGLKTIAKKVTPGPILNLYHTIRYGNSPQLNPDKLRLHYTSVGHRLKLLKWAAQSTDEYRRLQIHRSAAGA